MARLIDTLVRKGTISAESLPWTRNYRHLMTAKKAELVSSRVEGHNWLFNTKLSALKHIHTAIKTDSVDCFYKSVQTHTHTHRYHLSLYVTNQRIKAYQFERGSN